MPDDMVSMLEELERLALELGQALPKIVVTCSMQSLSTRQGEMVDDDIKSPGLLHPWMELADDPEGQEEIHETPVAKEKSRLIEPEPEPEPGVQAGASTAALQEVSTPSEQSLECIYLPKLAPEFLSGSSTSPVLQPAKGFHSNPAPATQTPRQRAFFSALKEPASTSSGIAKLLTPRSTDATSTAVASAIPKYRHGKSALPILKTRTGAMAPAAPAHCNRTALRNNSPGRDTGISPTKSSRVNAAQSMAACEPGSARLQQNRTQAASASIPRSELARTSTLPSRGIRHLFRRPPVRSASDPPVYSAPMAEATRVQRPVSEVVSTLREVEPRRMPRLPSARDLLRKLT
ncbi:hypothetical protein BC834DRAFT_519827 [Gloeopeniophorella convolvens]|nr:hypothetical protein BC834DRAFT_519827 [Gloeopeniophorella convolvens]